MFIRHLIGEFWSLSAQTGFQARSYEITCPFCDQEFTFEMGHLLDEGVDPADLRRYRVRCSHCGIRLDVSPKDVRSLT